MTPGARLWAVLPRDGRRLRNTLLEAGLKNATAPSCESLSFNPWNALVDHRPLGDFNRARCAIYTAMAAFRAERARP